jgi:apolipoprotein D and lipocalin family protein
MNFILPVLILIFTSATSWSVDTVSQVDLNRYTGLWYEVASIPAFFQKHCVKKTTAEYKKLSNGKIDVINSCDQANGKRLVANGIAVVKNTETNAELGVSFVPFLNHFGFFQGQYKVLSLGQDYEYSLVGTDNRKFGWILSRTPTLSLDLLATIEKEIRRQGYDSCQFLMSHQTNGSFSNREPLCEIVKQ